MKRLGLGLLVAAAGCTHVAQDVRPPSAPASFQAKPAQQAQSAANLPERAWLQTFSAPGLEAVVEEALRVNPDLQRIAAQRDRARASAKAAFGPRLPSIDFGLGTGRTSVPDGQGGRAAFNVANGDLTASWEVDIWGRVRDNFRAADSSADAAQADYYATRLSIAGLAGRAWIDLIEAAGQARLTQEDAEARARTQGQTERRYDRGVAESLDVRTARAAAASAQATASAAREASFIAARRLEALLGRYPAGEMQPGLDIPQLGALPPAGTPTLLLARRPDVAAAEARLVAAGFQLNGARKALLPRFTLRLVGSTDGDGLRDITSLEDAVAQVALGMVAPIFEGGSLRAQVQAAKADTRAAAYDYVSTAIAAWEEVENAIGQDATLAAQESALRLAAEEASAAEELTKRDYTRGVATIFDLVQAQAQRINAQRSLLSVRAARATNRIRYHIALGGGAEAGPFGATPAEIQEESKA